MADDVKKVILVGSPRSGAAVVAEIVKSVVPSTTASVEWDPMQLPTSPEAPDAVNHHYVLVLRNPVAVISSLLNAWSSRRFATDATLEDWWGEPWSFAVVPQWRELIGKPSLTICVEQWKAYVESATTLLAALPPDRWSIVVFEDLMSEPHPTLDTLLTDLGISVQLPEKFHIEATGTAVTRPGMAHWSGRHADILAELETAKATADHLLALVSLKRPDFAWPKLPTPDAPTRAMHASADTPFESHFTPAIPQLLQQARASLAISTYKSGHVIIARATSDRLDTEFVNVPRAMGIAVAGNRLAFGALSSIKSFTSSPALAAQIQSPVPIDSVYSPRSETQTGDVAIHDMAYGKSGDLYFVNTKFSCLCIQDLHHSFVPIWRPKWITALAPEDRCHLNGLAMVDGEPKYVTVLAQTDAAAGWREHRGTGGMIIDVTNDAVIAQGLAMPHSPRWHGGKLWVLESGKGALCQVDLASGRTTEVARLPGFTRGLAFIGKYAFVGMSTVRESVFSGLPVTDTAAERNCGVWMVDLESGTTVGMLKFSGMVQEVFEVAVLPAAWPTVIGPDALAAQNYVLPSDAMAEVPAALRQH